MPSSFDATTETPIEGLEFNEMKEARKGPGIDVAPGMPFVSVQNRPDGALVYLLPSRYYYESDRLGPLATDITAGRRPGYDQFAHIVTAARERPLCPGQQPGD